MVASSAAGASTSSGNTTTKIETNWTAFFRGTTPATTKETLLQNGKKFATFLQTQSKTKTARLTTVRVTRVKLTSKTTARVTYTIYLGGSPVEPNVIGTALIQDKVWKVSDTSFCALVSLEGSAPKACSEIT
jgi:hypothetical protein